MLCGCSFLRVGLEKHRGIRFILLLLLLKFKLLPQEIIVVLIPVIVFNEFHQLLLRVRFSWDEHWIVNEGFIEVHLIKLQLQNLGNL